MIRFLLIVLVSQQYSVEALNNNGPQLTRRKALSTAVVTAVTSAATPLLPIAQAATKQPESYDKVISQKELLSGLTVAPARNIIITGK